MSFQEQPQLQQPGLVYPDSATSSSNPTPTSHSTGSFGAVFIVLAVIVVVSSIACFLSRFLTKRHHHRSTKQSHHHHQGPPLPRPEKREPKQGHHGNFNAMGDIEFGIGKGFPNGKQFGNGAKAKPNPQVRFEFGRDPRVVGERGHKGGEFGAI